MLRLSQYSRNIVTCHGLVKGHQPLTPHPLHFTKITTIKPLRKTLITLLDSFPFSALPLPSRKLDGMVGRERQCGVKPTIAKTKTGFRQTVQASTPTRQREFASFIYEVHYCSSANRSSVASSFSRIDNAPVSCDASSNSAALQRTVNPSLMLASSLGLDHSVAAKIVELEGRPYLPNGDRVTALTIDPTHSTLGRDVYRCKDMLFVKQVDGRWTQMIV